ncbi:hypothetical protein P3W85_29350 [Cupriavidus basilensis]|uniref:Uncharacterized protein n=1 Tax=Cupriavidus basilensis TaxID=68895 RepID=A0ABT6AWM9_9BURK|nr:hypothetical protein [Cupriavidus basilensis]MDF3837029.1 hypothetical protein [Cupriavidus basilensis]
MADSAAKFRRKSGVCINAIRMDMSSEAAERAEKEKIPVDYLF